VLQAGDQVYLAANNAGVTYILSGYLLAT
jgi:hypothetical protein